jgi:Flp pilus assembly CpaE family ATPase
MVETALNILLIEDNPGDAELVKETLMDAGGAAFKVHCADALLPGLDRLARGDIDLVLLDLSLPDSRGLDGLNAIRIHAPSIPVVLLTGLDSESVALQAVQSGAQDYLVKGTLQGSSLARALQHAMVRQRTQFSAAQADPRQERATVVGLMGAKGGVGTTTVACHLGRELKRQTGGAVLLMDLDGAANPISFLMNANGPYSILDASSDILHLDQNRWEKLVAKGADGVDIIQSGGQPWQAERRPRSERVRFVIRLVRSFYRYIVVDMGQLSPSSVRVAEECGILYLLSTCEILGLNEAKWAAHGLTQAGIDSDRFAVVLNQAPRPRSFSVQDLEKILGVQVAAMLPEVRQDFADAMLDGKRLGESRGFHKHIVELAASIAGVERNSPAPKPRFSFLKGAPRSAPTTT